ncbi:MAG: hypothetical protein ACI82S_001221 [Patiriisocius sp.]|jgi:hypothetical protein
MKLTYQKHLPSFFFSVCVTFCLFTGNSYAEDNNLKDNELVGIPLRCVALRQGQFCYQEVIFKWHQAEVGNYCLVELSSLNNIKCWSQVKTGEVDFDFQSDKSLTYGIRKKNEQINLSTTTITVSWVFKSSKRPKSSWKLF